MEHGCQELMASSLNVDIRLGPIIMCRHQAWRHPFVSPSVKAQSLSVPFRHGSTILRPIRHGTTSVSRPLTTISLLLAPSVYLKPSVCL